MKLFAITMLLLGSNWGSSCLGPVGSTYKWEKGVEGLANPVCLFKDGVQIGVWDFNRGQYKSYSAPTQTWGPWVDVSPFPPPPAPFRPIVQNYGIDEIQLDSAQGCKYWHHGRLVSVDTARAVLTNGLPDDLKKCTLTVLGDPKERLNYLGGLPEDIRSRVKVWSVSPDDWSVKGVFAEKTLVCLQAPDGKVLHRQEDFKGVEDYQAIRKGLDTYDSKKDPDLRLASIPMAVWVIGGIAIAFFLWRKK